MLLCTLGIWPLLLLRSQVTCSRLNILHKSTGTKRVGLWVYSFRVAKWCQLTLPGHQINSFNLLAPKGAILSTIVERYRLRPKEVAQSYILRSAGLKWGPGSPPCTAPQQVCFPQALMGSDSLNPKWGASVRWQMPEKLRCAGCVTSCGSLSFSGSQLMHVLMMLAHVL